MGLFDWLHRKGRTGESREPMRQTPDPPPARRVAARALVLAALHYRLIFEVFLLQRADGESRVGNANLLSWVQEAGLLPEFEPEERALLEAPLGRLPPDATGNESWRLEGLGVLAWALQRYRLPPYDAVVGPAVLEGLELFARDGSADLRDTAVLRPAQEVRRYATQITIVSWRLRQFGLPRESQLYQEVTRSAPPWGHGVRERMDFVAHLRAHPGFEEWWLDGLRLAGGDLALGGRPLADASPEDVQQCTAIGVARQVAAYWLRGDEPIYSRVRPNTVLLGCS
jgi:hypothetical protein